MNPDRQHGQGQGKGIAVAEAMDGQSQTCHEQLPVPPVIEVCQRRPEGCRAEEERDGQVSPRVARIGHERGQNGNTENTGQRLHPPTPQPAQERVGQTDLGHADHHHRQASARFAVGHPQAGHDLGEAAQQPSNRWAVIMGEKPLESEKMPDHVR